MCGIAGLVTAPGQHAPDPALGHRMIAAHHPGADQPHPHRRRARPVAGPVARPVAGPVARPVGGSVARHVGGGGGHIGGGGGDGSHRTSMQETDPGALPPGCR